MASKLWVGGLPRWIDDDGLRELFASFGRLGEVTVVRDRASGQPRGFGYVSFEDEDRGFVALDQMDGRELAGHRLSVRLARESSGRARGGEDRRDLRRAAQSVAPVPVARSQIVEPVEAWIDDRPHRRPDRKRKRRRDYDEDDFEREPRRPRGDRSRVFEDQDEW